MTLIIDQPGPTPTYNLGARDVRADEIAVANIANLVYMPLTHPLGVAADFHGFVDRIASTRRNANGLADVRTRMLARQAGERATYYSSTIDTKLVATVNTLNSFTVAYNVCADNVASNHGLSIGCPTVPGGGESYWFLISDSAGKIRTGNGTASTQFADYAGPVVGNFWTRIVFELDRTLGRIRVFVDGAEHISLTHSSISSSTWPANVIFGAFSNTSSTAPVNQRINSPLVFLARADGGRADGRRYVPGGGYCGAGGVTRSPRRWTREPSRVLPENHVDAGKRGPGSRSAQKFARGVYIHSNRM